MACNNDQELWGYAFEEDAEINMSKCILNVQGENEGFPFGFDDETTPIKDCGDLVFNDINSCNKIKEGEMEESSQVKRRRTLQFESELLDAPFCNEVMPQEFLGSQDSDSIEGAVSELSQWVSSFTDNTCEALDLSSEEWVAECFNDTELYLNFDEIDTSGTPVCQATELNNIPSSSEANAVQDQPVRRCQNVIFKGRKSFMHAPSKTPASVVYPFDFIKPCSIRGDITLKDINQKLHTPPPKSKSTDDDLSVRYPKSAFSGKPVIGKTKICTEGGKGSITIMRTKG